MALSDSVSALTRDKFIPVLVDNIYNSNVLCLKLLKNAEKLDGGANIVIPIEYAKLGAGASGWIDYSTGATSVAEVETYQKATYQWATAFAGVKIPGEEELVNKGSSQVISLLKAKLKSAEKQIRDIFGTGLFAGTAVSNGLTTLNGGGTIATGDYTTYENGADGDFYELSSSWIEDIIYPDINDYCNFGWTSDFFDYDGMLDSIDETDGYSIALYAHYLTSVVANKDYSIIKHIWEDYRSLPPRKPVRSIDNVLKNEIYNYNTNFIDTWVDFISHNFFNGFYPEDSEYYYHPDQAITQPMTFNSLVPYIKFESPILVSKNISNESATLISINRVNQESQLDIAMNTTLENSNLIGNIILLSENNLDSQKIIDINDISEEIYDGIEYIYFVLGLDEPISSNEVIEDIDFDISFCNYLSKGDLKSDCILNVLDYIELIENIIFNEPFMSSCDLNEDTVCDAADAASYLP